MRILQLCLKPPYPPVDGGTMAMNSITQGLVEGGHSVKVLSVCSDKHPVLKSGITDQYIKDTGFEAVHIDLSVKPLDAAIALLCGESYNVKRFASKQFDDKLREILEKDVFDVVHVESIFLTHYLPTIRRHSDAKVILRAHNVEHQIWRQMAIAERNPLKRWYLKKLALALRVYEVEHFNDYDGIVCITADDAETFRQLGCRKPLTSIPFGIDCPPLATGQADSNALFHIGSMDWKPNSEAIKWFLAEVWPEVHRAMPQLHLHIAGRKMPPDLMSLRQEGLHVAGEVPDSASFIADKQVNIVPLKAGSGIRIKIIEAMAMGKTVITTKVGAQGIDYRDGENLIIADTPQEFVAALRRCTDSPDLCHQIGKNARKLVASHYNTNILTQQLTAFYNKVAKGTLH